MNGQKVILYVEDDPDAIVIMEAAIKRIPNVRLVSVESGNEGLSLLDKLDPSLIILDINLPDISGFDILSQIKSSREKSSTPVIAYTSRCDHEEKKRGLDAGFNEFLFKPMDLGEFTSIITLLLNRNHGPQH